MRQHYTLPIALALVLVSILAPVSAPVIGLLMLTCAALVLFDLGSRIGRSFKDGYRGSD